MNKFIAIYVTSTRNGGEPLEPETHKTTVSEICAQFSKSFGGCTCLPATGYWLSNTKGLIEEPITIVKSYHTLETRDALAIVTPIAEVIKYRFNQEAVSIETELGLEFI